MRKIYSVFDSKVGAYLDPIFLRSRGEALRMFVTSVQSPDNNFNKFPADFTLFELGSYDEESSTFDLHKTPISLGVGIEFLDHSSSSTIPSSTSTQRVAATLKDNIAKAQSFIKAVDDNEEFDLI